MQARVFEPCIFGRNGHELESIRADVRDVEAEDLCGFDAVIQWSTWRLCATTLSATAAPTARESR